MYPPPREPVGPGQESVWDYPRPPRCEQAGARITVTYAGQVIASTDQAWRVLETSHPPTYYLPRAAFTDGALRPATGSSYCEWKGRATYYDLCAGDQVAPQAAWSYPLPSKDFASLRDHVALYPAAVDQCTVDGEIVLPQPGGFYGGWITSAVKGPFKGGPGTGGW